MSQPTPAPTENATLEQAMRLLQEGLLEQAAAQLHQGAAQAIALGANDSAVRLLQLASATNRSAAEPEMARAQAEHALQLAQALDPVDASVLVLAWCEAAETAQALGLFDQAEHEFAQASAVPGLPDVVRASVLRRQATLLVSLGRHEQARQVLEQVLLGIDVAISDSARVRVDIATVAVQAQMPDAVTLVARASQAVQSLPTDTDLDYASLHADVHLLQADVAQQAGKGELAVQHAQQAMRVSLAAGAANSYAAACLSTWKLLADQGASLAQQRQLLEQGQREMTALAGPQMAQAAFASALALC